MKVKKTTISPTWHHHLVAALAAVAVLPGTAFPTHDLAIVSGAERLIGQWLVAFSTSETILMPVAVLMVELLNKQKEGGKFRKHPADYHQPFTL